jgi:hypothetical protein
LFKALLEQPEKQFLNHYNVIILEKYLLLKQIISEKDPYAFCFELSTNTRRTAAF